MTRFCFVGHTFHLKTKSTRFIIDIMKSLGEVDEYHSSPDDGEGADDHLILKLASSSYDCYVFLQTEYIAHRLSNYLTGRVVIIPMYDGAVGHPQNFWKAFPQAQFISFSRIHHELLCSLNCKSAYFRYFPPQKDSGKSRSFSDRTAFFWERRPDKILNASLVVQLCKKLQIEKLHLHLAADFNKLQPYQFSPRALISGVNLTTSSWIEDYDDFNNLGSTPLFYFAPRLLEGIGMSFLEAMGRGQIVVAPNLPTMNEYISHGVTGILYDPYNPTIDFPINDQILEDISAAAIKKYCFGRQEWLEDLDRFKSLLTGDHRRWSTRDYSSHFVNELRKSASIRSSI